MHPTFTQYTPADLYIHISERHPSPTDEATEVCTVFRSSGSSFLDAFVANLHQHGIKTGIYHASLLGINRNELCVSVVTLTGMSYTDFTETYILLMANDMLKSNEKDLKKLSRRLGFGSYSGFYRFMMRKGMGKPSWVSQ